MDISNETLNSIDSILSNAYSQKRKTLFEHEVYEILAYAGMDIPKYDFIEDSSHVSSEMLDKYSSEIVIKIVSQNIAHKQKIGGVQRIVPHDEFFVQYVLDKMKDRACLSPSSAALRAYLKVSRCRHDHSPGPSFQGGHFQCQTAFRAAAFRRSGPGVHLTFLP